MNTKITPDHLCRTAVVYVRQSKFPTRSVSPAEDDHHRMNCNLAAIAFISIVLLTSCWTIDALLRIRSGSTGLFRFDLSAMSTSARMAFLVAVPIIYMPSRNLLRSVLRQSNIVIRFSIDLAAEWRDLKSGTMADRPSIVSSSARCFGGQDGNLFFSFVARD